MSEKLKAVGFVCALLVLSAVLDGFAQPGSTMHSVFSVFTTLLIVVSLLLPVSESLVQAFSAMELSSNFLLAYIPAFAGVISMSGKPLSSAAYSSVMIGLSNLLAQCNVKVFLPVVQVFFRSISLLPFSRNMPLTAWLLFSKRQLPFFRLLGDDIYRTSRH